MEQTWTAAWWNTPCMTHFPISIQGKVVRTSGSSGQRGPGQYIHAWPLLPWILLAMSARLAPH